MNFVGACSRLCGTEVSASPRSIAGVSNFVQDLVW
jgi:hypothetical protein